MFCIVYVFQSNFYCDDRNALKVQSFPESKEFKHLKQVKNVRNESRKQSFSVSHILRLKIYRP